jgi:transposase-like protein
VARAWIQHAVWLYLRSTLSCRDVEDLLAERGLDISYETVRSWVLKFGTGDRATAPAAPFPAEQSMASGRDGGPNRR